MTPPHSLQHPLAGQHAEAARLARRAAVLYQKANSPDAAADVLVTAAQAVRAVEHGEAVDLLTEARNIVEVVVTELNPSFTVVGP